MTAILDFLFGLFSVNLFSLDYSKTAKKAKKIEEPCRTMITKVLKEHMALDPATASIPYNQILVKSIGDNILYIITLDNGRKTFSYFCKNKFEYRNKGYGKIEY